MLKKFLLYFGSFSLATLILFVTIFKTAEAKYVFSASPSPTPISNSADEVQIAYNLPYPGTILSDNILWPLKALRDRVWLTLTVDPSKKADLYLLLADKRLADAQLLFQKDKPDLGISVLTKAEKYLESAGSEEKIAKSQGVNTSDFLRRFILATEEHRKVMDAIANIAPEDANPIIMKTENYPKNLYSEAKNGLLEAGINVPQSPFQEN